MTEKRILSISMILICVVFITVGCGSNIFGDFISNKPVSFTEDEMTALFLNNKDGFKRAVEIILNNDSLYDRMFEHHDGDTMIMCNSESRYFNADEWKELADF